MSIFQKSKQLPNIKIPYTEVVKELINNGIHHKLISVDPNVLRPIHSILVGGINESDDNDSNEPIYISDDHSVLDGHYKLASALMKKKPYVRVVKIFLNVDDASNILNNIQNFSDYKNKKELEEVEAQDYINAENSVDTGSTQSEFLGTLDDKSMVIDKEPYNLLENKKNEKIIGYRNSPINEKSNVGNFFLLEPHEGFNKYEIEFENLLDFSDLKSKYDNPVEYLANIWFPHVNFNELSIKHGIPSINLINKAIADKAISMGFDGIKYKNMVQALK